MLRKRMTPDKKVPCLLLCLHMMLSLCACGREAPQLSDTSPAPKLVENSEEVLPFSSDTIIHGVARLESKLFLIGERSGTSVFAYADMEVDEDGKTKLDYAKDLSIQSPSTEDWIVYAVTAGGDGNLYLLLGDETESGASTKLYIQQYAPNGKYLDEMQVDAWPFLTVDCFGIGQQEEFVLCADNVVSVYRWQEGLLAQHQVDNCFVQSVSSCKDGLILSLPAQRASREEESPYYLIDPMTGAIRQIDFPLTAPTGDELETLRRKLGSAVTCQGLQGEFLANQGDWIYRVDFDTGGFEKLIEWNVENSTTQKLGSSCRLSDNSFACVLNGRLILSWIEQVPAEQSGQSPVRIALFDGTSSQRLLRTVKNTASHIVPYEYAVEVFDWDYRERIATEIMAGEWDLILFHDEIDTIGSGFENLYPFLDADPVLSRESFVPHLLESIEENGELHQLWNSAAVSTLVSTRSLIPEPYGLTMNDCDRIVNADQEIPSVIFQMADPEENQKRLLGMVALAGVASFVDKESASCSFDCDAFRNLLLWCINSPPYQDAEFDKPALLQSYNICSAADIEKLEPYFEGQPVITGFPNGGNGIHYFTLGADYERSVAMAIPSAGKNKEGAWAFIREMLSESKQTGLSGSGSPSVMPVLYDVVKLRNETAKEEYRSMFFSMLENTSTSAEGDKELVSLIMSSCLPYLNGEKTLEETVSLVQSRASIYVAEKYS